MQAMSEALIKVKRAETVYAKSKDCTEKAQFGALSTSTRLILKTSSILHPSG